MCFNDFIRSIIHLCLDQVIHHSTELHKSLGAFPGCFTEIRLHHDRVLPVVHIAVHDCEGIVFYRRVCRDCFLCRRIIPDVGGIGFLILTDNASYSLGELICQIGILKGNTGRFRAAVHAFIQNHPTENHARVINEIAVYRDSIGVRFQVYPFRLDINHAIPLLQENDIGSDGRVRICAESGVRKPDSPEKLSPLGNIPAHIRILLVHGALGGDESDHTAGANLIYCLGKEIVMNQEIIPVIGFIRHLIGTERHIADGDIKEVFPVSGLKAGNRDIRFRIKQAGNTPGHAVQLNAVQVTVVHGFRQHAEEVADTTGRLQDVSGAEAHLFQCLIHSPDHGRRRVMRI